MPQNGEFNLLCVLYFQNILSNQKHSCVVLQGAMPTHTESRNPLPGVREKSLSVYFLAFRQADKLFFLPPSYIPGFSQRVKWVFLSFYTPWTATGEHTTRRQIGGGMAVMAITLLSIQVTVQVNSLHRSIWKTN